MSTNDWNKKQITCKTIILIYDKNVKKVNRLHLTIATEENKSVLMKRIALK